MDKEQAQQWLNDAMSDLFLDFYYYDRKEDEDMDRNQMEAFVKNGIFSPDNVKAAAIKAIDQANR